LKKIIILLFLVSCPLFGNNKTIDSLENSLKKASGKDKVVILLQLSFILKADEPERAFILADEALKMSNSLNLPQQSARAYFCMGAASQEKRDFKKALEYYELYRAKAISNGNRKDEGEALFQIASTYYDHGDIVNAFDYSQQALIIYKEQNLIKRASDVLSNMGVMFLEKGNYDKALEYLKMSLSVADSTLKNSDLGRILGMIGSTYCSKGDYTKAVEYALNGLRYSEATGDKGVILIDYNNIADLYKRAENYKKAIEFYQKSLNLSFSVRDTYGITDAYIGLATVYEETQKFDSAKFYIEKCLNIISKVEDKTISSKSYSKLGYIYLNIKEYDLAIRNLSEALKINMIGIDRENEICSIYNLMSQAYQSKRDYPNALKYSYNSLDRAKKNNNLYMVKENYFLLSDIYAESHNYQKSLECFKFGSQWKDSLINSEKIYQIANLEANFRIEKKEKENVILKLEIDKQTSFRNYLIIISVLILLLAVGTYNRYLHKKKTGKILEEKNLKLNEANVEIERAYKEKIQLQQETHEKESQIMNLKNKLLEKELEQKQKELATLAINLVDKNEYLVKLKEQAESIGQAKPDEVYPFVRSIIRSINLNVKSEESWKIFESQFKAIHRGFMEYIATKYFDLTVMELKVCALLKINLSSKEISTLLNLSTRTVEDHRLNIRKKLGLDKDVNLNQFIATLQYIS
jgi:tetratricopeptide (TPR) repeat protein